MTFINSPRFKAPNYTAEALMCKYQLTQVYFLCLFSPTLLGTFLYTHYLCGRGMYAMLFLFTFLMMGSCFASVGIGMNFSVSHTRLMYISKMLFILFVGFFLLVYALNSPLAMLLVREWYFTVLFPAIGMYGLLSLWNAFLMTRFSDSSESSVVNWWGAVMEVRYSMLWPYLLSLTLMTGFLCTTSMKMIMETLFMESTIAQAESNDSSIVPVKAKVIDKSSIQKALVGSLTSGVVALICTSSLPFTIPLTIVVGGTSVLTGLTCYSLAENYNISYSTTIGVGVIGGLASGLTLKATAPVNDTPSMDTETGPRTSRIHLAPDGVVLMKKSAAVAGTTPDMVAGPVKDRWAIIQESEISGLTSLTRKLGISSHMIVAHKQTFPGDSVPDMATFKKHFISKTGAEAAEWFAIEKFRRMHDIATTTEEWGLAQNKYFAYLDVVQLQQNYSDLTKRIDGPTASEFRLVTNEVLEWPGVLSDEFIYATRRQPSMVRFEMMEEELKRQNPEAIPNTDSDGEDMAALMNQQFDKQHATPTLSPETKAKVAALGAFLNPRSAAPSKVAIPSIPTDVWERALVRDNAGRQGGALMGELLDLRNVKLSEQALADVRAYKAAADAKRR